MGIGLEDTVAHIITAVETFRRGTIAPGYTVEIFGNRPLNDVILVALARTGGFLNGHDSRRVRTHDPEINFDFRRVRVIPPKRS